MCIEEFYNYIFKKNFKKIITFELYLEKCLKIESSTLHIFSFGGGIKWSALGLLSINYVKLFLLTIKLSAFTSISLISGRYNNFTILGFFSA